MTDKTHNLEFAILLAHERDGDNNQGRCETDLEALILENLLDGNLLFLLGHVEKASGKDDAKGAIAYDLAIGILNLLCLTRLSIASDDLDYFVWVVWVAGGVRQTRGRGEHAHAGGRRCQRAVRRIRNRVRTHERGGCH
jgi:hypothetical protein